MDKSELTHLSRINRQAKKIATGIRILGPLSWPLSSEAEFLKAWKKGRVPRLKIHYPAPKNGERIVALQQLLKELPGDDPLEVYTRKSIESYILAAQMVDAAGSPQCQERSIELYGQPGEKMPGSSQTLVAWATRFLDALHQLEFPFSSEPEANLSAEDLKRELEQRLGERLGSDSPKIQIVKKLSAKATAGSQRVRLRDGTLFNRYDGQQLFVHEIMTHSLTSINGKYQKNLALMSLGSPRTTQTQEGLAAFSEVITGAIDIKRLSRLALRVVAIDRALDGASFEESFRFFLDNGQSEKESFWSAARIFRGGYPDKQIIFTKDSVYLEGLVRVYALFLWALRHQRLEMTQLLFCGRLALEDVFELEGALEAGYIKTPKYLPEWYEKIEGLAGFLSFHSILQHVDIAAIDESFFERD